MADVNVYASKGIELQKGDGGSPEIYAKVGGVQDMPAIQTAKSVKDRTGIGDKNHDKGLGIGEPGNFSLTLFWDPDEASHSSLITAHNDETKDNYRIVCPDSPATVYEFKSLISSYSTPYAGIDGDLMWDVSFELVENDYGEIVTKNPA
jgi:hypothetical protein